MANIIEEKTVAVDGAIFRRGSSAAQGYVIDRSSQEATRITTEKTGDPIVTEKN